MAITTRSGKTLPGPSVSKNVVNEVADKGSKNKESFPAEPEKLEDNETPPNSQPIDELEEGKQKEKEVVLTPIPRAPPLFPYRLKKKADDIKFGKFMAMLKQLTINFPLVEALEQMLGYAKFMKDLVTKKRAVIHELKDNLHHCGAISTRSLVQKKADPKAFTIPCTIGSFEFAKALCDPGENINLMPLVIYKKLGLGNPTPINMRLVMADTSIKRPVGILYDVLVKVENFIFPLDFVILDYEVDFEVTIILGRPFLAMGSVLINLRANQLLFKLTDEVVKFDVC
ncbi:uncharacterized protein LOC107860930 [Capsicum annuum]|uniref:uncharacterized protein LOC107860930 n=1 Tax=Capsicum annuum TaxID=4072 RepID=UPI001FB1857C|nr:uncharacterized protein LOC107860930 [Capsicum annuum]